MAPRTSMRRNYGLGLLIAFLLIASFSFRYSYNVRGGGPFHSFRHFQAPASASTRDTIPPKGKPHGSALDDQPVLDMELDSRAFEKALKNVEYRLQKIEAELRNKNRDKIENAYREAIDNIHRKHIERDTRQALAEVNKRIVLENDIHLDKIKLQLNKAKTVADQNLKQMQFSIDHDLKINIQNAKHGLQKAKASLQQLKAFTNDLEKDGLIEKGKPYSVEIKDGDLYINDVKQSKKLTKRYREKYKSYFDNQGDFKIHSGKGEGKRGEEELI